MVVEGKKSVTTIICGGFLEKTPRKETHLGRCWRGIGSERGGETGRKLRPDAIAEEKCRAGQINKILERDRKGGGKAKGGENWHWTLVTLG